MKGEVKPPLKCYNEGREIDIWDPDDPLVTTGSRSLGMRVLEVQTMGGPYVTLV